MTAVACVVSAGKVYMGADSALVDDPGSSLTVSSTPKVFRLGPLTVGWAGSARAGRVIQYGLSLPKRARGVKVDEYVARVFVDALRKALLDAGAAERHDNRESTPVDLVVAYQGRIWTVDEDFAAVETMGDYEAAGSGGDVVRGALGATPDLPARKRIMRALTLAEKHDSCVRRPFVIVEPAA
jgi:hypothetical protein